MPANDTTNREVLCATALAVQPTDYAPRTPTRVSISRCLSCRDHCSTDHITVATESRGPALPQRDLPSRP